MSTKPKLFNSSNSDFSLKETCLHIAGTNAQCWSIPIAILLLIQINGINKATSRYLNQSFCLLLHYISQQSLCKTRSLPRTAHAVIVWGSHDSMQLACVSSTYLFTHPFLSMKCSKKISIFSNTAAGVSLCITIC